jgi:biopolymer transport protein ExbB
MSFDLVHIFRNMDIFSLSVVTVLVVMGIASLSVFFERLWVYTRAQSRSRRYATLAADVVAQGRWESLTRIPGEYDATPLADLLASGLKGFTTARGEGGSHEESIAHANAQLIRARERLNADLNRGLGVLASVGSVAPFVGLLGTVIGIIAAFQGIAREGSGGLGAVSGGIAEALVVTALGLCIAIPAVLAFNLLNARLDRLLLALDQTSAELLDHLKIAGRTLVFPSTAAGAETRHVA